MRIISMLTIFFLAYTSCCFGELEIKIAKDKKRQKIITFYREGEEIAKNVIGTKMDDETTGNIIDGIYKEFDKNGIVKSEWEYSDGKLNGMYSEYYDGRRKKYERSYVDGLLDGPSRYYSGYGYLIRERIYKKGILDGVTREFYQTGQLKKGTTYVSGKKHGIAKEFYKKGTVKSEKIYDDDILIETKLYGESGEPVTTR